MKELHTFRKFLNEDQMKNLAKLLRDEADQPDNKVGKDIMLKYAAQAEKTDVKDIKSLLKKLEDELIDKHPDRFSGDDDIVGSFLSVSKNYMNEEETVKEAYTPQGVEVRDVKDFIGELQDSINLAQNYLNGEYDQDEMSTTVLINDLEERLRMMADEFPSYKGGL